MKTHRFLFAPLILIVSLTMQAQTIDTTSEWRVNYQMVWEPYDFYNNLYRDFIDGDTVINSIEYYKIYQSGFSYYGYVPGEDIYPYDHVLHGFLREENNKWYTLYENQDTLLFDFTLNVGDTVISAYTYTFPDPIVVTAVDSILIDGEYKKRMQLNGMGAEYIIEGIGATSGLFENMFFFEWYSELVCYARNGVSVWGTPTEECDLAVKINEYPGRNNPCVISPNPCKDFIKLSIPPGIGKVEFRLIDLTGQIACQGSFTGPSSNSISVNDFPPGFYLAIIESEGLRQTTKLIIE